MRLGSTLVSDLVFSSAHMPIEQSIVSYSRTASGLTYLSCSSLALR
jgi:hypothetical protein